jgi:hypothetical protein
VALSDHRHVWCIDFQTNFPVSPKSYTLVTANDNSKYTFRRPRTWALLGKRSLSDKWTRLTMEETAAPGGIPKTNALPITDKTAKEYAFTDQAPKDMKYFRLEIINTWSNERNHSMQLAEFQFNYDD